MRSSVASSSGWPGQTNAAKGQTRHGDQALRERDALVAVQHRTAPPDLAVAVANGGRDAGDFESFLFALVAGSAQELEGFKEESSDEVRLKSASLRPFHVLADPTDRGHVHAVAGERAIFEQVSAAFPIHKIVDRLFELGPDLGLVAIP